MKCNKQDNQSFLEILEELLKMESNEWMKKEVINILKRNGVNLESGDAKIDDIHKYMKLDVDQTVIDYSLFPDNIRITLERDCLEMQKWRHGKMDMGKVRGFDITFGEYCRYAHMQAENLVNFYFKENYTNESHLKDFLKIINANIENKKWKRHDKTVDSIPYGYKLNVLLNLDKITIPLKIQLDNMRNLRNNLSHRGISYKTEKSKDYLEKFLNEANYSDVFNSLISLNKFVVDNIKNH